MLSNSQIASTLAGSHWACRVQTDYAVVVMNSVWKVVDSDFFSGCEDPEFQRRKKFYTDFIAPNPAPQKGIIYQEVKELKKYESIGSVRSR